MRLGKHKVEEHNQFLLPAHRRRLEAVFATMGTGTGTSGKNDPDTETILQKLIDFQIAIPSWALGTGGTRFGRFTAGGDPRSLEEKMEDIGLLHTLNRSSGAISL